MNRLGFRRALVSIISALVLLSLSITIVVSNQVLKKTASEDLKHAILSSATYESARIAKDVAQSAETVEGLAKLHAKYSTDVPLEKLVEIAAVSSGAHKVTVGFEDGSSYASKHDVNFPGGIGDINKYDPRTRPWFKQGRASRGLALSDVFFTTRDQQPMLGAIHPVEKGVMLVDIRLNHLHELLKKVNVVEGAVGIITDGEGVILASTAEFAPIQKKLDSIPEIAPIASHIYVNDHTFNTLDITGKHNLFVSKQINLVANTTWYLMITVDTDIAFATVNAAAWKLNSLALIIACVSIFVLVLVLGKLYKPVLDLKATIQNLSSGEADLTSRLEVKSNDDLGDIAIGVNAFISNLQSMLINVQSITTKLSKGVEVLRQQEHKSADILKNHLVETDQVVTAMEELSCSAKLVSEHAAHTENHISEANAVASNSKAAIISAQESLKTLVNEVELTTENITKMNDETQDIASILSVIGGIAEQTNLLALNAAIEAARAGEQGRGFAVVADEVRALANKTQLSTREIETALNLLKDGANSVVVAIERTSGTSQNAVREAQGVADNLGELTGYVTKINDLSAQISTSANEQNNVIQEISRNMSRIHNMVDGLNAQGEHMREETQSIEEINKQLVGIVGEFKLY